MRFEKHIIEDELVEAYSGELMKKGNDYVKRIKNSKKKEYAEKYFKYIMAGRKGKEPEHELSPMGAQAVRMNLGELFEGINEAPIAAAGWTDKSVSKFGKTIGKGPKEHGFFDACVARMEGKMGEKAKGFCASIKDAAWGSGHWRGPGKSKEQVKKDTKKYKFKKQLLK